MTTRLALAFAAGFFVAPLAPVGARADALVDRDNGPLTGLFGFPDSTEGSRLDDSGKSSWGINLVTSSHSSMDVHGGESILLDGETSRFALSFRRGVGERLELGIEIPYLFHETGNLDSLIDSWHDFFGLPDGIRDERANDQLLFSYADGNDQFLMSRNASGLGDVRLIAGWEIAARESTSTALRFGIKLPTGDSDHLLGSGSLDVSIGIAGDAAGLLGLANLDGFYRVNAIYLGRPDILSSRTNSVVGQVSAGLSYAVGRRTTIGLQTLVRSPVYDSRVKSLGDVAASLTAGVSVRLSPTYRVSLAVVEDMHVESLPDVTFALSLEKGDSHLFRDARGRP